MRRYIIFPDRTSSAAHIFMPWPYNIDMYQEMIIPPLFVQNLNNFRHGKVRGGINKTSKPSLFIQIHISLTIFPLVKVSVKVNVGLNIGSPNTVF